MDLSRDLPGSVVRTESYSPGLADINHIDSIRASFPQVWLHVHLQIFGPEMTLCSKKHFDILRSSIKTCGEIGRHVATA